MEVCKSLQKRLFCAKVVFAETTIAKRTFFRPRRLYARLGCEVWCEFGA
jgi:hypothetical protein